MEKKADRKRMWIICGIAAAVMIAALVLLLLPGKEDIPTFGLKSGMSREEMKAAMEMKGMACVMDEALSDRMVFIGETKLFGQQPSLVSVVPEENKIIFGFCDEDFSKIYSYAILQTQYSDLQSVYDAVNSAAVKKLGDHPEEARADGALWNVDGAKYELQDQIDVSNYFFFSVTLR